MSASFATIVVVLAVLVGALAGALAVAAHRRRLDPRREGFATLAPFPAGPPDFTRYKLCTAQNVCATQAGVDPSVCRVPEVDGEKCCAYNAATKTCQSKYPTPVPAALA